VSELRCFFGCLLVVGLSGCSATPLPQSLTTAQTLEAQHHDDAALAAYDAALAGCWPGSPVGGDVQVLGPADCGKAAIQRASLLSDLGRYDEAAAAFDKASTLPPESMVQGVALEREAELRVDRLNDPANGVALAWRVIKEHPDAASAPEALKLVVRLQRSSDPRQLYKDLAGTFAAETTSPLAPELLFAAADVAEHELKDPRSALARYDDLAANYRDTGLWDDAVMEGARLSRSLGDPEGALTRYRALTSTRVQTYLMGSFTLSRVDEAAVDIGDVYAEDEHDLARAEDAWSSFLSDYPQSRLRSQVYLKLARAYAASNDPADACQTLASMTAEYPDLHVTTADAAALAAQLSCATGSTPSGTPSGQSSSPGQPSGKPSGGGSRP
jgi:tetratricopeptide (TPR) repeat protein